MTRLQEESACVITYHIHALHVFMAACREQIQPLQPFPAKYRQSARISVAVQLIPAIRHKPFIFGVVHLIFDTLQASSKVLNVDFVTANLQRSVPAK